MTRINLMFKKYLYETDQNIKTMSSEKLKEVKTAFYYGVKELLDILNFESELEVVNLEVFLNLLEEDIMDFLNKEDDEEYR